MKGTTYKRKLPSGRTTWCLGIDLGKDKGGKRQRVFKSGFRREVDAQDELTKLMAEMNEGTFTKPDPRTLAEFLDQWMAEYASRKVAPKTLERYRDLVLCDQIDWHNAVDEGHHAAASTRLQPATGFR
jgi:integrase